MSCCVLGKASLVAFVFLVVHVPVAVDKPRDAHSALHSPPTQSRPRARQPSQRSMFGFTFSSRAKINGEDADPLASPLTGNEGTSSCARGVCGYVVFVYPCIVGVCTCLLIDWLID